MPFMSAGASTAHASPTSSRCSRSWVSMRTGCSALDTWKVTPDTPSPCPHCQLKTLRCSYYKCTAGREGTKPQQPPSLARTSLCSPSLPLGSDSDWTEIQLPRGLFHHLWFSVCTYSSAFSDWKAVCRGCSSSLKQEASRRLGGKLTEEETMPSS